jgi:hypothetical protein
MYELLSYSAIKKSIATSKLLIFKIAILLPSFSNDTPQQ